MKFNKKMLMLYAITDRKNDSKQELYSKVEEALKGGITMLQLREKSLNENEFIEEAIELKKICHSYNVPLIINDNLEVALKAKADGVHVGITDTPVSDIRKRVGKDFIIGATAKTLEQAKIAYESGADYMGVGAVFPSPTKQNAVRITNEKLNEIALSVPIPCVAIGGICDENIMQLKGSNIDGVAVVSAIFSKSSVYDATANLLQKVKKVMAND